MIERHSEKPSFHPIIWMVPSTVSRHIVIVSVESAATIRLRVATSSTTKATVSPSDMPVTASFWKSVCSSMKTHRLPLPIGFGYVYRSGSRLPATWKHAPRCVGAPSLRSATSASHCS